MGHEKGCVCGRDVGEQVRIGSGRCQRDEQVRICCGRHVSDVAWGRCTPIQREREHRGAWERCTPIQRREHRGEKLGDEIFNPYSNLYHPSRSISSK